MMGGYYSDHLAATGISAHRRTTGLHKIATRIAGPRNDFDGIRLKPEFHCYKPCNDTQNDNGQSNK